MATKNEQYVKRQVDAGVIRRSIEFVEWVNLQDIWQPRLTGKWINNDPEMEYVFAKNSHQLYRMFKKAKGE